MLTTKAFLSHVAVAAALTAPMFALAQATTPQTPQGSSAASADQSRPTALTREQVRLEVERAMRDGTWRCRTSNRGWCSNEAQVPPQADMSRKK